MAFLDILRKCILFTRISHHDKEHPNRVWVKRMIPCVWSFMKRRRPKDYVKLLEILLKEAQKSSCTLKPSQALIDFELAAKKAYDKV